MGRTGKQNLRRRRDGDVWGATSGGRVHMYGARVRPVLPPHRAARQKRERRARPRRRLLHPPARPVDERLADRDPRPRLAVFAGTVRRVGEPDHEPMPVGRDRPAGMARPRRGRRARRTGRRRWRSGPGHRRCAPPDLTVCVGPRESVGGTGGVVSRARTKPGDGDPIGERAVRSRPGSWRSRSPAPRGACCARPRGTGRWCADAGRPTRFTPSSPSPTDAVRDGSAKLGHPVQNVTREHGLTPLPR